MSSSKPKTWVTVDSRTKDLHPSKKRWRVQYVDPDTRKRRSKGGFSSKADAQSWADEHSSRVTRGEWIDPDKGRVTFREVAWAWFDDQHFDRERTKYNHRKMFGGNNALMTTFGDVPIGEITPSAVSRFIKDAASERAAQTVRHQFYALRVVLDWAVENNLLLVNPARRIKLKGSLPKPADMGEHERKRHRLTTPDVDRLIDAMPEPYDMYVLLLASTGLRPEEACGLTLAAVDTDNACVSVYEVVVEVQGRLVREAATKTPKSRRTIDLDPYAGEALARYVEEHRRRAAKWFAQHPEHEHPGDDLPLFVGTKPGRHNDSSVLDRLDYSKPLRHSGFYKRYWTAARDAAGLPTTVRAYDLRHYHASTLLDAGMSFKDVQERMGHAKTSMTIDRYWHSRTDDEARRARRNQVAAAMGRTAWDNVRRLSATSNPLG